MTPLTTTTDSLPRAPSRPAWLRLVHIPRDAAEREALATRQRRIGRAADVAEVLATRAQAEQVECFYVLALNAKMRLIAIEEAARGSLTGAAVQARDLLRLSVVLGAYAVIVAHNHPSGDTTPSTEDITLTRRLVEAGSALGMPILDHVILAGGSAARPSQFYSFSEAGVIPAA
jgi:DNA repair protein RadC